MNKGFTKLEIILVGVILLIAIGLVVKSRISNPAESVKQNPTKDTGLCRRTTTYDNPPELARSLSLVSERWNAASGAPTGKGSMKNCLHLIYKDHSEMNDAEGFFSFDKNSSPNDIRIYIDSTYKSYDDILSASLLKHEVIHATIYYMALEGTPPPSCIENEVDAFYSQLVFLVNLNPEEWKSITYRLAQNPHLNSAYEMTNYLLLLNKAGDDKCANDSSCWTTYVKNELTNWVSSNPYYQKECSLN